MSVDLKLQGPSVAKRAAWIIAISALAEFASRCEVRIFELGDAAHQIWSWQTGPIWLGIVVPTILVALTVPWFETVAPRRMLVVAMAVVAGISCATVVAFRIVNQVSLASMVLFAVTISLTRFLAIIGNISYVGLLRHHERVDWYLLKQAGTGLAGFVLASMLLSSGALLRVEGWPVRVSTPNPTPRQSGATRASSLLALLESA